MFDAGTRCVVVVGAQWGDEGKGKLVDVLAERADFVVRYQGGANAGHTVVIGSDLYVLHQIPSGILHSRATCIIGNGVVLDAEQLFAELDDLTKRSAIASGRLLVSDRAHLVLPLHKQLDVASERKQNIGTTGRGIGPCYEDKVGRRGLRVGNLRNLEKTAELLAARVDRANHQLHEMGCTERASLDEHVALMERLAPRLLSHATDTGLIVHRAVREGRSVLLEGAQGALLDVDHGTYPFVTSSNTTAGGAAVGAGIGPTAIHGVLGVVKAYTTRVGNGPLPTEAEPALEEQLRDARRRVRRDHGTSPSLRLVRRERGAVLGASERPDRARDHEARRARHLRRGAGGYGIRSRWRGVRGHAGRCRGPGAGRAGVRGAEGLESLDR